MRNRFDSQLEALNRGIIEMGALVEDSLKASIDALLAFDRETAKKIVVGDKEIVHQFLVFFKVASSDDDRLIDAPKSG